jgi:hypothetical protein
VLHRLILLHVGTGQELSGYSDDCLNATGRNGCAIPASPSGPRSAAIAEQAGDPAI